jgi:D-glycero-D-manno-heptose 1,7-bisphosphate phosphatase
MSRKAIFMDRDGTICEEVGYVNHVGRSRLLPNSLEAIRLANQAGYLAIVATNQSGVARGLFDEALVEEVHRQLAARVAAGGGRLEALYYCPHHPREGQPPYRVECDCRKPLPGMLLRAAREHDIDLARSWMVGDSLVDLEAGAAAGVGVVHVLTGYGLGLAENQPQRFRVRPQHTAPDLLDAVRWILARHGAAAGGGATAGGGR